ncbi:MAG: hypothetical protein NTZ13_01615 [Candidatus Parcubacteria bacterium]|nr:hypothetical protein [Candidatus Parcubacteria bacterium]
MRTFLLVIVLALFGMINVRGVEAKSTIWTMGSIPDLYYYWNCGGSAACDGLSGWALGLSGVTGTVTYHAQIVNVDTKAVIEDDSTVNVGTRLMFEKIPYVDSDIFWNGTGSSMDTPIGTWIDNAAAPANPVMDNFKVNRVVAPLGNGLIDIYIPLSITPPISSLGSTSNLSCLNGICTVTGPGAITASVNFSETSGKFYYKYLSQVRNADINIFNYFTSVPMRTGFTNCYDSISCLIYASVGPSDYVLSVPAQQIDFTLTALAPVPANNPPSITFTSNSANNYLVNNNQSFTLIGTDADAGDKLAYGIDWDTTVNSDGVGGTGDDVDQLFGHVNNAHTYTSGTTATGIHPWTTTGTKGISAVACDQNGACSPWTPISLVISGTPTAEFKVKSLTASTYGTSVTGAVGANFNYYVASSYVTSCSVNNGVGAITPNTLISGTSPFLAPEGRRTYTLTCTGNNGSTITRSATVTSTAVSVFSCQGTLPPNTTLYPGDATVTNNTTQYTFSTSDTAPQCQYHCSTNFHRSGGTCIANCEPVWTPTDTSTTCTTAKVPQSDGCGHNRATVSGTKPCPVITCGTAAKNYTEANTSYTGNACGSTVGAPAVAFPAPGSSATWTCGSLTCTASRSQNGRCGSANGIPSFMAPSVGARCYVGSATEVTKSTVGGEIYWNWTCGSPSSPPGVSVDCSARKTTLDIVPF